MEIWTTHLAPAQRWVAPFFFEVENEDGVSDYCGYAMGRISTRIEGFQNAGSKMACFPLASLSQPKGGFPKNRHPHSGHDMQVMRKRRPFRQFNRLTDPGSIEIQTHEGGGGVGVGGAGRKDAPLKRTAQ